MLHYLQNVRTWVRSHWLRHVRTLRTRLPSGDRSQRRPTFRPCLEALEPRWAPAGLTLTWSPNVSNNWEDAANWKGNTGAPPGAGDIAVFDGTVSNSSCTIQAGSNITVKRITEQGGYSKPFTLNGNLTIQNDPALDSTFLGDINQAAATTFTIDNANVYFQGGSLNPSSNTAAVNIINSGELQFNNSFVGFGSNITVGSGAMTDTSELLINSSIGGSIIDYNSANITIKQYGALNFYADDTNPALKNGWIVAATGKQPGIIDNFGTILRQEAGPEGTDMPIVVETGGKLNVSTFDNLAHYATSQLTVTGTGTAASNNDSIYAKAGSTVTIGSKNETGMSPTLSSNGDMLLQGTVQTWGDYGKLSSATKVTFNGAFIIIRQDTIATGKFDVQAGVGGVFLTNSTYITWVSNTSTDADLLNVIGHLTITNSTMNIGMTGTPPPAKATTWNVIHANDGTRTNSITGDFTTFNYPFTPAKWSHNQVFTSPDTYETLTYTP